MYSKNGIPWVRPPTHDGQHRENNIGRTEQWSMNLRRSRFRQERRL